MLFIVERDQMLNIVLLHFFTFIPNLVVFVFPIGKYDA